MASHLRLVACWLVPCLAVLELASSGWTAEVKLARHPDIHNGKIVFSYLGDLWLMNEGAQARRITVHKARDIHPRFSPDGKYIAFSSNRYGNYDVFVMAADGGPATRLTYHSANDTVVGWSRDSQRVIFSSRGQPYGGIARLYDVPVGGGLEEALPVDWGYWGSYSPDGKKLAFNRHPMTWSRKHYRGSYAADLWVHDLEAGTYTRLVDDRTPDEWKPNNLWPMYANGYIYFVSDRSVKAKAGTPEALQSINNIWKVREAGGDPEQVTHHTSGALFFPALSSDAKTIIYEENFGLCKLDVATGQSTPIKIDITTDDADNTLETLSFNSEADSFGLSPSGKRAVISIHGELFSIATEKGETRRLTRTPGAREALPTWSPDGKRIAFVGDEKGHEAVYLCDEFGLDKKEISKGDAVRGQLRWSPDAKFVLYTSGNQLLRYNVEDGQTLTLIQSDKAGGASIQSPQWSPDGKWISFTKQDATFLPHVYVMPATGGPPRRITDDSSYSDSAAHWTADGKYLVYLSGMELIIPISSIQGKSSAQIFRTALERETDDPADKGVDSEEAAAKQKPPRKFGDGEPAAKKPVEVKIDFERIARRSKQLTRTPDNIGSISVAPDGKTIVFATSGVEGGRTVQSIWSVQIDSDKLTRVAQSSTASDEEDGPARGRFGGGGGSLGSLQFARDGRTLFYQQGKSIYSTSLGGGQGASGAAPSAPSGTGGRGPGAAAATTGAASAGKKLTFTVRVDVNHREQRMQIFRESWRVMKHRFYDPAMHGVDWQKMRSVYEPLMDHVATQDDLFDVVNMLLGELNASHTGISAGAGGGRGGPKADGEVARFPGFELEAGKDGAYRVSHIYKNGPADKDYIKLSPGNFIVAVDDEPLKAGDNYWKAYASTGGARMQFTVNNKPVAEGAWKIRVTPVSAAQQGNLQYERWVDDRRAMTLKLSGGDIGYLHIRQMSEPAYRQFERDLASLRTKKALVIDQRFNPGGNIDQELLALLGLRQYQKTKTRDAVEATRPMRGYFGPMVVLANERSTSDAEVFPDGFRTLKLGKIVGVTTYGAVIGTGSHRLMDGSALRTPSSGLWNVDGTNLENYGVRPDVYVDNAPADYFAGRDRQLERAIEVLREQMAQK